MRTSDLEALNREADTAVMSAIDRIQNPKEDLNREFKFRVPLKTVLGRERIYSPVPEEAQAFFENMSCPTTYDAKTLILGFTVVLLKVAFTPSQAAAFNKKMASFGR